MIKRIISALKDGIFVFLCPIFLALLLNFLNFDFGHNRIWSYLGSLGLINVFDDKELNGLIVLGFILGVIAFALGFSSPAKDKKLKSKKD